MSTPRNAEYTKIYNQKLFLRLLHRQPLSRADIARKIGLTRASASLIADELLREGWIVENKLSSVTKSGRPPVALRIAKDSCYAVGVFLNRDGCSAGIVSFNGEVICKARFKLSDEEDKLQSLCESLEKLISASGVKREKIMAVVDDLGRFRPAFKLFEQPVKLYTYKRKVEGFTGCPFAPIAEPIRRKG